MIQKKNLKFKRNAKRISAITLAAIMGLSPSIVISDPVYGAEKTTSGKLLSAASEKTTSESLLSATSENTDADQTNSDTSEESDQLLQNDGDYQASPKTGAPGGGSSTSVSWSGASTITSATTESNKTYTSTSADENALLVNTSSGTKVTLENPTVEKSGGTSASDNYSFYGINSAIMCKGGGETTITGGTVNTTSAGANGIFSYGANSGSTNATVDGTTVNISDTVITTTAQGSGGIMTTYGGTTKASNLTITTSGGSSAPIRTDRGGGWVTVDGGTYTSNGQGSPAIYSTADVDVSNATLVSNKSEGVCIEGNGSIELTNCDL
nr:hypothetical protein [Lachnospiraceae bacterium]